MVTLVQVVKIGSREATSIGRLFLSYLDNYPASLVNDGVFRARIPSLYFILPAEKTSIAHSDSLLNNVQMPTQLFSISHHTTIGGSVPKSQWPPVLLSSRRSKILPTVESTSGTMQAKQILSV